MLAERAGFEPAVGYKPHIRLAGEHLQPARSPLRARGYRFFSIPMLLYDVNGDAQFSALYQHQYELARGI
jgi:hypothetical protein